MQSDGMGHAWDIDPMGNKCIEMEMVISGIPGMP